MKRAFALFFWIAVTSNLQAQNLFDISNTEKFANYLKQSGQFNLAAVEYERLAFLLSDDDSLKITLLDCYLLDRNYEAVYRRSQQLQTQNNAAISIFHSYASFALLSDNKFESANLFLNSNHSLSDTTKAYYQAWNFILQDKFKEADKIVAPFKSNHKFYGLTKIQDEAIKLPRKSPAVAGILSAFIPGSGKWYAHERKDAVIGFLSIAALSYQAYRGFKKDGQNSVYGWISAGLGTGFYLGNIYGSIKSVKRFNSRQYAKLQPSIEKHFTIYR